MNINSTKWITRYLRLAREVSTWSKDPSRQIGAVVVSDNGIILSTGYNGFPRNIIDEPERLNNREEKYKYVVHAEMNCIYNASYNGVSLFDSHLFVYGLPVCSSCMNGIMSVGIKTITWTAEDEVREPWLSQYEETLDKAFESGINIRHIKQL